MAELLNRELQRALLERLYMSYPATQYSSELRDLAGETAIAVNLAYLAEHGLVDCEVGEYGRGAKVATRPKITAKGVDFLADDGGLGAILGTVTVKLHSDTVRDLLIARVRASDEPDTVKARLIDQLKATPAVALGQLTERALDAGLQAMPRFAEWLQAQF
ncbi:hypothetical protein [Luteimonas sp. FCS-9]|uniref:hypothetical protein n=1 Tax=Luteimonas sp. FCS-9 TaxID=1547516 RepID=UPI00063EC1F5|nr:hypothetical protein [Luteimonas sp. FCS-9]KLJ02844.1 hypothetical protein WQ56_00755 [Luteimonas sp. FCS-9]